jgi:hypothetical protein
MQFTTSLSTHAQASVNAQFTTSFGEFANLEFKQSTARNLEAKRELAKNILSAAVQNANGQGLYLAAQDLDFLSEATKLCIVNGIKMAYSSQYAHIINPIITTFMASADKQAYKMVGFPEPVVEVPAHLSAFKFEELDPKHSQPSSGLHPVLSFIKEDTFPTMFHPELSFIKEDTAPSTMLHPVLSFLTLYTSDGLNPVLSFIKEDNVAPSTMLHPELSFVKEDKAPSMFHPELSFIKEDKAPSMFHPELSFLLPKTNSPAANIEEHARFTADLSFIKDENHAPAPAPAPAPAVASPLLMNNHYTRRKLTDMHTGEGLNAGRSALPHMHKAGHILNPTKKLSNAGRSTLPHMHKAGPILNPTKELSNAGRSAIPEMHPAGSVFDNKTRYVI